MGKLSKDNKGFGTVELVMAVVIIVLIAVVGWMVYRNHHKTTVTTENPYTGWNSATLKYEQISYKYPSSWSIKDSSFATTKTNNQGCAYPGNDDVLLTSPGGSQVYMYTGQNCTGGIGPYIFSSIPIKILGQSDFLSFENSLIGGQTTMPTLPAFACIYRNDVTGDNPVLEKISSKNIYDPSSTDTPADTPFDTFCYYPSKDVSGESQSVSSDGSTDYSGTSQSVSSIEGQADFRTAKLIFESMKYIN